MERDELSKLTVAELRAEARRRGLTGVDRLRREQLIERLLSAEPQGLIGKAKRMVKRAAEKATGKIRSHGSEPPPERAAPTPAGTPPPEVATETVARLYEEQGHTAQALAIYRRILAEDPSRTDLNERIRTLAARTAPAPAPETLEPGQRPGIDHRPPPPPAPSEPFGMLDYEELPEVYGADDCIVMPRDPWNLFVYWEVTPDGRAAARSHLGQEGHAARLTLRLYTVGVGEGGVSQQEQDIDLDWDHGRRVVPAPRQNVRVSVAVGLRAPSGAFAPIAHSGVVLIPPAEPGPEGPVEWMEVLPVRRRGAEFEPVVIVTRGGERIVRGAPGMGWQSGTWHHPGSRAPLVPEQFKPGGGPSSPWLSWPSSHHRGNR